MVVGQDLVKQQIKIANNEKLAFTQDDLKQTGHAIECRIYAEDTENNFMPSPGKLIVWAETRDEAIQRMKSALYNYKITGIKTSIKFLERIMNTPDFVNGKANVKTWPWLPRLLITSTNWRKTVFNLPLRALPVPGETMEGNKISVVFN